MVLRPRKKLASAQTRQTGEEQSEATRRLYQKLSVLLVRGNSALLPNRFPTYASPDIYLYLPGKWYNSWVLQSVIKRV